MHLLDWLIVIIFIPVWFIPLVVLYDRWQRRGVRERLLDVLPAEGWASIGELSAATGKSTITLLSPLYRLQAEGAAEAMWRPNDSGELRRCWRLRVPGGSA